MREREEMKRQIKTYRDKLSNCEKYYKNTKNELKSEKENSEKLFLEICLNEKIIEQMNKNVKDLTISLKESNEKISFLLTEKSKNAEIIRNQNDYIEKIELQIKEISEVEKEFRTLEENYQKEINLKEDIIKKMENFLSFKNQNIDFLYDKIQQVTKNNLSLDNSQQELLKNFESMKSYTSKKIYELEKNNMGKGVLQRDYNKLNLKFPDRKTEEEFEIIKMENENYKVYYKIFIFFILKKKLQCKICCLRDIDSIINKCNHTFCRECIENMVNSRQRICPKCRHKISLKDVSEIWID